VRKSRENDPPSRIASAKKRFLSDLTKAALRIPINAALAARPALHPRARHDCGLRSPAPRPASGDGPALRLRIHRHLMP